MFEGGGDLLKQLLGIDIDDPEWTEEISRKMSGIDYNIDWAGFFGMEQWGELEKYIMREQSQRTQELVLKDGDCERLKGKIQGLNFLLGIRESILGDIEAINQKKREKMEETEKW